MKLSNLNGPEAPEEPRSAQAFVRSKHPRSKQSPEQSILFANRNIELSELLFLLVRPTAWKETFQTPAPLTEEQELVEIRDFSAYNSDETKCGTACGCQ